MQELLEELALTLQALVERQAHRGLDGLDAVLRRAEAADLPRDGLAELAEDLRLALRVRDLVGEIANLLERSLLVQHLLCEGNARRGEVAVHDLVDEADLERFVGADRIAAHDHGQSFLRSNDARETLRATRPRKKAKFHFRQAEARV